MPSKTEKQAKLMRAVAHGWKKPGGGGPSKAVAKEFTAADKGRKFGSGTTKQQVNKQDTKHGKMDLPFTSLNRFAGKKAGGTVKKFAEGGQAAFTSVSSLDENGNPQKIDTAKLAADFKKWQADHAPKAAPKAAPKVTSTPAPKSEPSGSETFMRKFRTDAADAQAKQDARPTPKAKDYGDTKQAPKFDPLASSKAVGKGILLGSSAAGLPGLTRGLGRIAASETPAALAAARAAAKPAAETIAKEATKRTVRNRVASAAAKPTVRRAVQKVESSLEDSVKRRVRFASGGRVCGDGLARSGKTRGRFI